MAVTWNKIPYSTDVHYIGTTSVALNRASAALTLAGITLTTPDIGTPSAGDLRNCTLTIPPAIGETTPNTIRGYNVPIVKTAEATLTPEECAGTLITNYGQSANDAPLTLPNAYQASKSMSFLCILGTTVAKYFRFIPYSGQAIIFNGTALASGKYVSIASAVEGASIAFQSFRTGATAGKWLATVILGTWVAET